MHAIDNIQLAGGDTVRDRVTGWERVKTTATTTSIHPPLPSLSAPSARSVTCPSYCLYPCGFVPQRAECAAPCSLTRGVPSI